LVGAPGNGCASSGPVAVLDSGSDSLQRTPPRGGLGVDVEEVGSVLPGLRHAMLSAMAFAMAAPRTVRCDEHSPGEMPTQSPSTDDAGPSDDGRPR
jgi:hypothetical protein